MITDLWIENFKGIGKRQHIPLRPVTLLFGTNSAGKSTVLHALLYLRELLCRNRPDPTIPLDGEGTVNLGGFQNALHRPNADCIRIEAMIQGWDDVNALLHYIGNYSIVLNSTNQLQLERRTGMAFNGYDFPVSISVTIRGGRISELLFSVSGFETIAFRESMVASSLRTEFGGFHLSGPSMWFNPASGAIDPDFYEMHEQSHSSDDFLEASQRKALQKFGTRAKRVEHLLADCFEASSRIRLQQRLSSDTEFVVSSAVLSIPSDPEILTSAEAIPLVHARLNDVIQSLAGAVDVSSTSQTENLEEFYVSFRLISIGPDLTVSIPWAVLTTEEFRDGLFSAVSLLRTVFYEDEVVSCERMTGRHSVIPDLNVPLPFGWLEVGHEELSDSEMHRLNKVIHQQSIIDELVRGSLKTLIKTLDQMLYVGPKRSSIPRQLDSRQLDPYRFWGDGLGAWRWLLVCSQSDLQKCSEMLRDPVVGLGTGYSLERIGLVEVEVSRLRSSGESSIIDQPPDDPLASAFAESIRSAHTYSKIELRRSSDEAVFHPQDLGEGITQLVPVVAGIIQGISAESRVGDFVAVEQPELHLHPSLAARIGDLLLLQADKKTNLTLHKRPSLLIETHSEHLILRILRRIRQTTDGELPDHIPPVKPDDVCVMWVDNLGQGTTFQRLRISEDGDFIDRWPRGFFTERAEELY